MLSDLGVFDLTSMGPFTRQGGSKGSAMPSGAGTTRPHSAMDHPLAAPTLERVKG